MSFNPLRAIANRLSSTAVEDLPRQVGYLATSLADCTDVLSSPDLANDQQVSLHKLKTRVSALLQDRTPEGRFAGIIIVKALVENGGPSILTDSGNWIRALISCLNKPDIVEVKRICIVTITRIYLLTVDHQTLVREVTTPTLPAFISTSLGVVKPSKMASDGKTTRVLSPLLDVVLRSWHILIPHFASTFRPSVHSIKSICLSLIGDPQCLDACVVPAQSVLASLHFCAPKSTGPSDWSQLCQQVVEAAHDTADLVFRAINEDWMPVVPRNSKVTRKQKAANTPSTNASDVAGLDAWSGVTQGCRRICDHVNILKHLVTGQHAQEITIPLGTILDLTGRLAAVAPPTPKFSLRTNNEITKDEREELWLNVADVHFAVLKLFKALAEAFGTVLHPVCNALMAQALEIFDAESNTERIRAATYDFFSTLLPLQIIEIRKSDSAYWTNFVQRCCTDLTKNQRKIQDAEAPQVNTSGPRSLNNTSSRARADEPVLDASSLYISAYALLPRLLTFASLPKLAGYRGLRSQIDQAAILINHQEALLASVVHPYRLAHDSRSLLPFLSRNIDLASVNDSNIANFLAYESLVRPRMPSLRPRADPISDLTQPEDGVQGTQDSVVNDDQMQWHANENMPETTDDVAASSNDVELGQRDSQAFSSGQKRDFTALLEQTTDAQLAESALSQVTDHSVASQVIDDQTTIKRPRMEADRDQLANPVKMVEDTNGQLDVADYNAKETFAQQEDTPPILHYEASANIPVGDAGVQTSAKGNENAGYESDDSSASEIPPIDATLVGMSDSEDE